jgi:hypothetical protein
MTSPHRIATLSDGFEHLQLTGFNDGDGLRAGGGREAFQEIFNGFTAFQGVNQILQRDRRADKDGHAAHDFGIRVNDALQIFDGHNMAKISLPAKLSPANMAAGRALALHDGSDFSVRRICWQRFGELKWRFGRAI